MSRLSGAAGQGSCRSEGGAGLMVQLRLLCLVSSCGMPPPPLVGGMTMPRS